MQGGRGRTRTAYTTRRRAKLCFAALRNAIDKRSLDAFRCHGRGNEAQRDISRRPKAASGYIVADARCVVRHSYAAARFTCCHLLPFPGDEKEGQNAFLPGETQIPWRLKNDDEEGFSLANQEHAFRVLCLQSGCARAFCNCGSGSQRFLLIRRCRRTSTPNIHQAEPLNVRLPPRKTVPPRPNLRDRVNTGERGSDDWRDGFATANFLITRACLLFTPTSALANSCPQGGGRL